MKNDPSADAKSGNRDKIEGNVKILAGKLKKSIGHALGDIRLESTGYTEQIEGQIQKKIGQIKNVLEK